ncbi:hypothetical protein, partial [Vibrio parahaemolyticus]
KGCHFAGSLCRFWHEPNKNIPRAAQIITCLFCGLSVLFVLLKLSQFSLVPCFLWTTEPFVEAE